MGARKTTLIILLILDITIVSTSQMDTVKSESSSEVTLNDELYAVDFVMGGFGGNVLVCSFNASKGYWIELKLISSSNDSFKVFLDILSANHEIIHSATGKNFSEIVYLDYEDTYEITISKSPFYSSVRVKGTIGVFHQETSDQSSLGNWVEKGRLTGFAPKFGESPLFIVESNDWRIKWEYVPHIEYPNLTAFSFHVQTHTEVEGGPIVPPSFREHENLTYSLLVGSVIKSGTEETNGTLYINSINGTFVLDIVSNADSYVIIIEENMYSIPEFPSWTLLLISGIIATFLMSLICKQRIKER